MTSRSRYHVEILQGTVGWTRVGDSFPTAFLAEAAAKGCKGWARVVDGFGRIVNRFRNGRLV